MLIQANFERQFESVRKEWVPGASSSGLTPSEQDAIDGVGGDGDGSERPRAQGVRGADRAEL